MSELQLLKNYIDAKFEYELTKAGIRSTHMFQVSTSLTPGMQALLDRYVNTETELNLAIQAENGASKREFRGEGMNTLELLKNYVDAKIAYELSPAGADNRRGGIVPSVSYDANTQRIIDHWITVETDLNRAIHEEKILDILP